MVDEWTLQYDRRQYRSMADQLRKFEEGKLDLASLIASLKALLNVLEAADDSWKDDFRSEWGTLEVAHAVALFRKEEGIAPDYNTTINDPSNRALVNEAVHKLGALLASQIGTTQLGADEFGDRD